MERLTFNTSDTPQITITRVRGSLRVKGWDRPEVRIDADSPNSLEASQEGDTLRLDCAAGGLLRLPMASSIFVKSVSGDAIFKSTEGQIEIYEAKANLILKVVGPTTVERVNGNLTAKLVQGDLQVEKVGGNLTARQVDGVLKVESVSGNAIVRDAFGDVTVYKVGGNLHVRGLAHSLTSNAAGNATLRLEPEPLSTINVSAKGNIQCRLALETSAEFDLKSSARSIRLRTPEFSDTLSTPSHQFTLGDGESTIKLDAVGRVELLINSEEPYTEGDLGFDFVEDISNFADQIGEQISEQIDAQMDMLSEQLNNLNIRFETTTSRRTQDAVHRAERKLANAQRKLSAAQRHAELKARLAAQRAHRAARKGRGWDFSFGDAKPDDDPVTDDERAAVLQMVQDKKISVEEAEMLLAALEGQFEAPPDEPPAPQEPPAPPEESDDDQ